ncbi:hypothetical protein [Microbacterium sp. PM5]|uniref:hypothetical protein n=1 Tax=Microbacterium sp. PM5 TaxID=2014534 RepID=UPI000DD0FBF3|nr:hypothetical protein [Microbacterium sp. PM5]AXA97573.1 hypothetical protein CEP17_14745 [Microbacterium sp. PM5]
MGRVEQIKKELRLNGSVQVSIVDDDEAEEWRRDARRAARELGRPVETIRHRSIVVAALRDWPANELEEEVTQAKLRTVMNRVPTPGL